MAGSPPVAAVPIAKVVQSVHFAVAALHAKLDVLVARAREVDPSTAAELRAELVAALETLDTSFD